MIWLKCVALALEKLEWQNRTEWKSCHKMVHGTATETPWLKSYDLLWKPDL